MKSIRSKILSLNLSVILLCTLVLGGISIFFLTQNQEKDAEKILRLTTDQMAEKINTSLYSIQSAVDSLSAAAVDTFPGRTEVKEPFALSRYVKDMEYITRNIADNTEGVCAYYLRLAPELTRDQEGFLYTRTEDGMGFTKVRLTDLSKYDPGDTEHVGWYYQPMWAGKPIWMEPYYNKNLNIYMISYVVPLFRGDTFLGVLGMDVDFDMVNSQLQENRPYETSHAFITSDSGQIYYPPDDLTVENISDAAPELADLQATFSTEQHKTGTDHKLCTFEYNGVRRVLAHSHIINDMNLMLDAETREIYATRNTLVIIMLAAALLITAVAALISMHSSRRITEPLKRLTEVADKISQGDLNVEIPESTGNEVGILAESMRQTVNSLRVFITGMRNQAYTDSLTHVRNKRAFDITLMGLSQRISKDDRRFGLMMLDVNNLKDVNDHYGHAAGDEYLINCCRLICSTFSHSPVFRIGGDEFVVLLENQDYDNYRELIDEMDACMEECRQNEHPQDRLSIARGASFCMPTDKDPEEIFRRADHTMYINKESMKKHSR